MLVEAIDGSGVRNVRGRRLGRTDLMGLNSWILPRSE